MSPNGLAAASASDYPSELHDLVEGLGVIVWQADALDRRFRQVSANAVEVLGYPVAEWLEQPDFWISHIHPYDREQALRLSAAAAARGEAHKVEYRATAACGRTVWLRDIVQVSHGLMHGLTLDITEQKEAELAVLESEERFRQMTENIREVFWLTDAASGRVLYVSPGYERLWGRTQDSLYADPRSGMNAVHPDDLPGMLRAEEGQYRYGSGFREEFRIIKPDGEVRWVGAYTFPVRDATGKVYRFVGRAADITERKHAEAIVSESEERFRKLFEESPVGTAIISLDRFVKRANRALCTLAGRSREELEGLRSADFVHPDDLHKDDAVIDSMLAGEIDSFRTDKRLVKPCGEIVWAHVAISVVRSEAGRPLYALAMAKDVTEQRRAQDRLRELSGRLIRLQDEERRRIARELRDSTGQNLAALRLNLSRLREAHPEPAIRRVVTGSLDLTGRMLQEIRTLSYLLHPPLLDELGLHAAIRTYVAGFNERSGIEIQFDDPPALQRFGKDLEIAIFRIIQEALTNIHRHSGSKRGWISISLEDGEIRVEVRDEGRGLAPGALDESQPGLGVGISGMRERARQLGGRLEIVSESGGCTVKARFRLGER